VFLVNAASFVGVLAGLLLMKADQLHRREPVPREKGQLREGLRYVRHRPDLVILLVLVFFISTFGLNFYLTLAVMARNVFGGDASAYGLLSTLLAVGTLSGATLAAKRSARGKPRLTLLIGGALVFGVLEVAAGLMPNLISVGITLIPLGIAMMTFTTTANATVQLSVSPAMRGRVMGLYMLVFLGGTPLGGPVMGWLADHFTGRAPLIAGGVIAIVTALVGGAVLVRRGGLTLPKFPIRARRT
jgi:MFS family permease